MGGTFDGSEVLKMQANLSEENVIFQKGPFRLSHFASVEKLHLPLGI